MRFDPRSAAILVCGSASAGLTPYYLSSSGSAGLGIRPGFSPDDILRRPDALRPQRESSATAALKLAVVHRLFGHPSASGAFRLNPPSTKLVPRTVPLPLQFLADLLHPVAQRDDLLEFAPRFS